MEISWLLIARLIWIILSEMNLISGFKCASVSHFFFINIATPFWNFSSWPDQIKTYPSNSILSCPSNRVPDKHNTSRLSRFASLTRMGLLSFRDNLGLDRRSSSFEDFKVLIFQHAILKIDWFFLFFNWFLLLYFFRNYF